MKTITILIHMIVREIEIRCLRFKYAFMYLNVLWYNVERALDKSNRYKLTILTLIK